MVESAIHNSKPLRTEEFIFSRLFNVNDNAITQLIVADNHIREWHQIFHLHEVRNQQVNTNNEQHSYIQSVPIVRTIQCSASQYKGSSLVLHSIKSDMLPPSLSRLLQKNWLNKYLNNFSYINDYSNNKKPINVTFKNEFWDN